jgi:hypothetical protein
VLFVIVLASSGALACRYNVREVGFIDIGIDPYYMLAYLPAETSTEDVDDLRGHMEGVLAETNIRFEPRLADTDPNDPSMQFVKKYEIDEYPSAVLVSPDGQSRQLKLTDSPDSTLSLAEALAATVPDVLHSPKRKELLERCADSYAVALLLEGPNPDENTAAREAIGTAIGRIKEQLDFLPKPIATAPVMVALKHESLAEEETLLWSLGLKPADVNVPHAAVLYGRGRWFGPMFTGEALNADNLTELLFIVGADCECGLDHRWLQGTMLPARWSERFQAKVAKNLGFDPENPMIKMEMVSIIRRGMGGYAYPGTPFGYQEMTVGGEPPEPAEPPEPVEAVEPVETPSEPEAPITEEVLVEPPVAEPNLAPTRAGHESAVPTAPTADRVTPEPAVDAEPGDESGMLLAFLGGGTVVVALAGMIVFFKTRSA